MSTLKLKEAVVPVVRRTGNEQVDAAFRELNPFMTRVAELAVPRAQLVGIGLVAGTNRVRHNLGRSIRRWNIVDRDSAATVYRTASAPTTDADPKAEIWLVASATVTVTLELW